jgi:hypothetical protein
VDAQVEISFAAILLAAALSAQVPPTGDLLHRDDFQSGLNQWIAEMEKPGAITAQGGVLNIDVPAGCTLWFKRQLSGPVMIQYDAKMIQAGGPNDRVSDLNCFWMATDATTRRSGKFSDYDELRTYYVGQGGNSNTTTRFRRYVGRRDERPLLPEHDLRAPEFLLRPNLLQLIQLVASGSRIQYFRDGRRIFDFTDPDPYTRGHFAFRTTASHIEIRNFRVFRLK